MKWRKYPDILELHTRIWLEEISKKHGRTINFDDFPEEELNRMRDSNFDAFWLMGVWKRSSEAREIALNCENLVSAGKETFENFNPEIDIDASAYSVCDYSVDKTFGSLDGFTEFKKRLEPKKIILDFVPNHTSRDSVWIENFPQIYMQGDSDMVENNSAFVRGDKIFAMGKDPNFPPWNDTAQLDYSKTLTREKMKEVVENIAKFSDGLRCDMAMLVTNSVFSKTWGKDVSGLEEFWKSVIRDVKKQKDDFLFIAEVYWGMEWDLQQQGFDYTYDKTLYDRLKYGENSSVYGHLHAEKVYYEKLVRFLENHDEERSLFVFGKDKLLTAAVLTYFLPGMRLFFQGQFQGRKKRMPIQFKRWPEEEPNPVLMGFFEKLLEILSDDVFHFGKWCLLDIYIPEEPDFSGVFSYHWSNKGVDVVIIMNNTLFHKNGYARVDRIQASENTIVFKDVFTGKVWERDKEAIKSAGLYFDLEPYEFKVYRIC
ncbi:alpha-amylase [candidate division WOR-3 bacterium]|nr:alpha-amylase [candidate division WOR-3 bacterium]